MKRTDEKHKCQCDFCRTYDRYIWAVVAECGCECHRNTDLRPEGHDGLCCEFPNGKKADNPYNDLKEAVVYKEILDLMESQENLSFRGSQERYFETRDKIKALIKEHGI